MTMTKDSAAFKEVSVLLRSLITPHNNDGGIRLSKLYEEYKEEEQEELPFRALGYSSITALLDAVENVHVVCKYGDWYATTTPNSKTAHIHELIANQKSSTRKKRPHPYGTNRFHNAGTVPSYRPPSGTQSRFSSAPSSSYGYNRSRSQPSNDYSSRSRSSTTTSSSHPAQSSYDRPRSNYNRPISTTPPTPSYGRSYSYSSVQQKTPSPSTVTKIPLSQREVHVYLPESAKKSEPTTNSSSTKSETEFRKPDAPSSSKRYLPSNTDYSSRIKSSTTSSSSSSSSSLYNRSSSSRPAQSSYDRPRGNYNGSITTTPPSYGRSYSYSSVQQKTPSPPTVTKTPLSQRKVHVYLPESAKKSEPTTPPSNSSSTKSETEFRKPDAPSSSKRHLPSNTDYSSRIKSSTTSSSSSSSSSSLYNRSSSSRTAQSSYDTPRSCYNEPSGRTNFVIYSNKTSAESTTPKTSKTTTTTTTTTITTTGGNELRKEIESLAERKKAAAEVHLYGSLYTDCKTTILNHSANPRNGTHAKFNTRSKTTPPKPANHKLKPRDVKRKEEAAKKAIMKLCEDMSNNNKILPITKDDKIIAQRIVEIVNAHRSGVIEDSIPNYYKKNYNELLPNNWTEILVSLDNMIEIDNCVAGRLIIIKKNGIGRTSHH